MFKKAKNYFVGARKEFKSITWPNWSVTRQLTAVVIGISLGFAFFLGVFDYMFSYLLQLFVV